MTRDAVFPIPGGPEIYSEGREEVEVVGSKREARNDVMIDISFSRPRKGRAAEAVSNIAEVLSREVAWSYMFV